ncbi:MAG: hypothetical protein Q9212_005569, partial [Teloschistes hypoglaucus]
MPSRKLNEYLDTGLSDEDSSSGHSSENAQESKGRSTKLKNGSKRQKTSHESSDEGSDKGSDDEDAPVTEDSQPYAQKDTSIPLESRPIPKPTSQHEISRNVPGNKVESPTSTAALRPPSKPG